VPVFEARDIVKTYPGVRALDGVSFDLRPGEVHAVVGENGAGKSTLIHVLSGVTLPESGILLLDGRPVVFPSPHEAARHGIGVVFQELSLVEDLSIAENLFVGRQPAGRLGLIDRRALRRQAAALLSEFRWNVDPETPVRELRSAQRQVVEILKALSLGPRVLILDEPTSSLAAREKGLLFNCLRRLRREGRSIVYISHRLAEVFEIADRVTVLRDGRRVDTRRASDLAEGDLVRLMVGRELSDVYGTRLHALGAERLRLVDGRRRGAFAGITLSVRRGEIVGLAGLAGAGRTELGRALFGAEPLDEGTIILDGATLRIRTPGDAIRAGIAYLTESRKEDGLFLELTLRENCAAPRLGDFCGRFGLLDDGAITRFAESCRKSHRIASPGVQAPVASLSGGNQQKVLLAMWLGIRPRVLIADEPTRGVDVGARSEICQMLRGLAANGTAILLISSDLPELLGLSDRIVVLRGGRLAGEFQGSQATEEAILACAAGVTEGAAA